MSTVTEAARTADSVPLDWSEFFYTNCPLVSASNIDQELGWIREELKKIGVEYKYLRSVRGNNWYPHYITTWTTCSGPAVASRRSTRTPTSALRGSSA
jgi:hypothetical protein